MLRIALLLILIVFIARAFWRVVDGVMDGVRGRTAPHRYGASMVRDPVCGTFILPDQALSLNVGSQQVFFCSAGCRDRYQGRTA